MDNEEGKRVTAALWYIIDALVKLEIALEGLMDARDGRLCDARESIAETVDQLVFLHNHIVGKDNVYP